MKKWMKWAGVAALTLAAGTASAADHTSTGTDSNPLADINDVFAWHTDGGNVALIMTVGGTSGAMMGADKDVYYVFNVTRHDSVLDAPTEGTETKVICQIASSTEGQCWVGADGYVKGDISAAGGAVSADGKIKLAGQRAKDPFFFSLGGFGATVDAVKTAAPNLTFNAAGCPAVDGNTSTTLLGLLLDGKDDFATLNVYGISLEVDPSLFAGSGKYLSVYASTHAKM